MAWTKEDREALLSFKTAIDCDDIRIKELIKKVLLNNRFIVHVLNNEELEAAEATPDEYFEVNILPYYMIPDIQHTVANYICYEVNYDTVGRYNDAVKKLEVVFHIVCRQEGIMDKDTGVSKHDLLAALIQDQFNFMYMNASPLELISDVATVTDSKYVVRTLIFQQITDNNLVKTRKVGGVRTPMLANKVMIYENEQH